MTASGYDLDEMPIHCIVDRVVARPQFFPCILDDVVDLPGGRVVRIYEFCNAKDEFEGVYYSRGFSVCV